MLRTESSMDMQSFFIGNLVKTSEPNDLEALPAFVDLKSGVFVKKILNENQNEFFTSLVVGDTLSHVYGVLIYDPQDIKKEKNVCSTLEIAIVGRVTSKLSIVPNMKVFNEVPSLMDTSNILAIGLIGDNAGVLNIHKAGSVITDEIVLPKEKYHLRINNNKHVYLEIIGN